MIPLLCSSVFLLCIHTYIPTIFCFWPLLPFTKDILVFKHFFTFRSTVVTSASWGTFLPSLPRGCWFWFHMVSLRETGRINSSFLWAFNMVPDYLSYFSLSLVLKEWKCGNKNIARVLWSALCQLRSKKTKKARLMSQVPCAALPVCPF